MGKTFWNGEPCKASLVRVIVGKSMRPTWWCAKLEGTERQAVRVEYGGAVFYLDNEDGSGWRKVTDGRGSPQEGHSSLPDSSTEVALVVCGLCKGKGGWTFAGPCPRCNTTGMEVSSDVTQKDDK